jgi:hypothetical protein
MKNRRCESGNRRCIDQPTARFDKRFPLPTNRHRRPSNGNFAASHQISGMTALLLTFLLGVLNFAMHKAVLESRHPMLGGMPFARGLGGRGSLVVEFLVLLGAMLLVGTGSHGWAWAYAGYTAFNAVAAWLILTRRV